MCPWKTCCLCPNITQGHVVLKGITFRYDIMTGGANYRKPASCFIQPSDLLLAPVPRPYPQVSWGGYWGTFCGRHFWRPTAPDDSDSQANHITVYIYIYIYIYRVTLSLNTSMALKSSGTTCAVRGRTYNRTKQNIQQH